MLVIKDIQESYNNIIINENPAENAQLCQKYVTIFEKVEKIAYDSREDYAGIMCEFCDEVNRKNEDMADKYVNNIINNVCNNM